MKTVLVTFAVIALVFCLTMYVLAGNPILTQVFEILWTLCACGFLLVSVAYRWQAWSMSIFNRWRRSIAWRHAVRWGAGRSQREEAYASTEQLIQVCEMVRRVGLALSGSIPEMEARRHLYDQKQGQAVPARVLSSQQVVLSTEFECLIKVLSHMGFPDIETLRLPLEDLVFIQLWLQDLEQRVYRHVQKDQ